MVPSGKHRGTGGEPRLDFFSILLWILLAAAGVQAVYSPSTWAIAWTVLGVLTLLARRGLPVHLVGVMEAPIFLALLAYPVTTLYLSDATESYDLVHNPTLDSAMWIAWMGMASFLVGMVIAFRRRLPVDRKARHPIQLVETDTLLLYAVGMIVMEYVLPHVSVSFFALSFVLSCCAPVGLFTFLALQKRDDLRWTRTWKFALWVLALLFWSVRSVLGGIFGGTLLILFIFLLQYAHRSKAILLALLAGSFFLGPLMQDTKSDFRQRLASDGRYRERALKDVILDNFQRVILHGDWQAYEKGLTQLASRVCTFEIWLSVKRHMEIQRDFAHGKTIGDALVAGLIPRILWPDKPITGGSSDLAEKYADMIIPQGTSVGVGAISEFYINAGGTGVLTGMFLLGWMGGNLLRFGCHDRVQPLGSIMSIFAFSQMIRPETNVSDILGGMLRMIFLWAVLRWWFHRSHRRNRMAQSHFHPQTASP